MNKEIYDDWLHPSDTNVKNRVRVGMAAFKRQNLADRAKTQHGVLRQGWVLAAI